MSTKVFLADHHPVVRAVLSSLVDAQGPEFALTGTAADTEDLLRLAADQPADVYLLDVSLPGSRGMTATQQLLAQQPGAKIIVLSLHHSDTYVRCSLKAGARGYLVKDCATEELGDALRQVAGGSLYVSAAAHVPVLASA